MVEHLHSMNHVAYSAQFSFGRVANSPASFVLLPAFDGLPPIWPGASCALTRLVLPIETAELAGFPRTD